MFDETNIASDWVVRALPPSFALSLAAALFVAVALCPAIFSSDISKDSEIYELGYLSILTAWPFFRRRYDFLKSNFAKTGLNMFSFKVLHYSVVAVKGEAARRAFFDNKSLHFLEGYRILMGGAPPLKEVNASAHKDGDVTRKLLALLHKDRIAGVLPALFDDIHARMEGWGKEGRMDPFKDIYNLVFQMTVRMATCRELATDMAVVDKVQQEYWMLEQSATVTALLLPWFPSTGNKIKDIATKNLFTILEEYVETRRKADVPSSDAIDLLLAYGSTTKDTITLILTIIFAGVINTGVTSCWALLYLSLHREWKEKVSREVNALIQTHTDITSSDPLHKRLSVIPVSAWEEGMPSLDLVIRETLRLTMNGALLRRNILEDLEITGKRLPKGHFLAYPLSDAHLNPDIYKNPTEFDPTRFMPGREEDKRQTYAYLGWGTGRHPCTGMRIAKLEIKVIIALFLARYEYDVVDSEGKLTEHVPEPDYNDMHRRRPSREPSYLQFRRVVE